MDQQHQLTPRQKAALQALIAESSIQRAADKANLDESTIRRYMKDEAFVAAYEETISGLLQDATSRLKSGLGDAVVLLRTIISDEGSPLSNRITAARLVLEYGLKYTEMADIEARVKALEQAIR